MNRACNAHLRRSQVDLPRLRRSERLVGGQPHQRDGLSLVAGEMRELVWAGAGVQIEPSVESALFEASSLHVGRDEGREEVQVLRGRAAAQGPAESAEAVGASVVDGGAPAGQFRCAEASGAWRHDCHSNLLEDLSCSCDLQCGLRCRESKKLVCYCRVPGVNSAARKDHSIGHERCFGGAFHHGYGVVARSRR